MLTFKEFAAKLDEAKTEITFDHKVNEDGSRSPWPGSPEYKKKYGDDALKGNNGSYSTKTTDVVKKDGVTRVTRKYDDATGETPDTETPNDTFERPKAKRGRPAGVGTKSGSYKPRDPAKRAETAAKTAASKAANKAAKAALTNEDCEEIFEGLEWANDKRAAYAKTNKGREYHTVKSSDAYGKAIRRRVGIENAVKRLTKEDLDNMNQEEFDALVESIDSLDEISKLTLATYIDKATGDAIKHVNRSWGAGVRSLEVKDKDEQEKLNAISNKELAKTLSRQRGIRKAVGKLKNQKVSESTLTKVDDKVMVSTSSGDKPGVVKQVGTRGGELHVGVQHDGVRGLVHYHHDYVKKVNESVDEAVAFYAANIKTNLIKE